MAKKFSMDDPKEWPDDIVMRERRLRYMVMFLAVVTILSAFAVVVQYRQTRILLQESRQYSAANNSILQGVNSCTKPGGSCYESGVASRALLSELQKSTDIAQKQRMENRARLEEMFKAVCDRQEELAAGVAVNLRSECPMPITPANDGKTP